MSKDTVLKSYYMIKVKGYAGKEDKFVTGKKLTSDPNEATRFEYFGLKGMEKSLKLVVSHASELEKIGYKGLVVVGGDLYGDIDDIESSKMRTNMKLWRNFTGEDAINGIINLSKSEDNDGETSEDYVVVHKFLSHVKRLNFEDIMQVAVNWDILEDETQMSLAVGYAGDYSASRFAMYMDYLNQLSKRDDTLGKAIKRIGNLGLRDH